MSQTLRLPRVPINRPALSGALLCLLGCGSVQSTGPTPKYSFAIDTSYGTLSFHGTIDRVDRGSNYEYRPHIDVTFHPDRPVNRTPEVNLIAWRFVASIPAADEGPWRMLYEEHHPINVHLSQEGQTAHLPDTRFRLSKDIAAQARVVGFAVLDGRRMWPIPVHLQ